MVTHACLSYKKCIIFLKLNLEEKKYSIVILIIPHNCPIFLGKNKLEIYIGKNMSEKHPF